MVSYYKKKKCIDKVLIYTVAVGATIQHKYISAISDLPYQVSRMQNNKNKKGTSISPIFGLVIDKELKTCEYCNKDICFDEVVIDTEFCGFDDSKCNKSNKHMHTLCEKCYFLPVRKAKITKDRNRVVIRPVPMSKKK